MLKILIKKQLYDLFRSFFYDQKKNEGRSKLRIAFSIGMYAVIIVGVLGSIFTGMCIMLCEPLVEVGLDWLYFAMTSLVALFLGVFGSVFNTYSGVYLAKDNDLLLSMPIPVSKIMISRLAGVFIMGSIYSCVVSIPAAVIYWLNAPQTALSIIGSLLLVVIIAVITLLLSCLLGYVVARISVKLKNKSIVTVLTSLGFIAAYYLVYFKALNLIQNITDYVGDLSGTFRAITPLYYLGCVGEGNLKAMITVTVISFALLYAVCSLIVRSFLKVATSAGTTSRVKEKAQGYKVTTPYGALLRKEFGRLGSSASYMLNCSLGSLFMVIAIGAILIKGDMLCRELLKVFGDQPQFITVLLAAACCAAASMNDTAASSVSLEGKCIWIPQSMPVDSWTVIRAKLDVQLLLTVPLAFILAVCGAFVLHISGAEAILCIAIVLLYSPFSAMFGMLMNLRHPNLNWSNEIYPIKQSFSVFLALMVNFLYAAALAGLYLLIGEINCVLYMGAFLALTVIACALLLTWLKKKGTKLFEKM